jgi:hypothetical protein
MMMTTWQIDVSGPITVVGPGGTAELRAKERSIVAALALHHPTAATAASLAPLIWGDDLPSTAIKSIHNHVSRIRASTPGLIDTAHDGYRLASGSEIQSSGGTSSYNELADQPQVAVARARDRMMAMRRDELLVRDRVRRPTDDQLVEDLIAFVDAAPQRLVRWWWLALTQARLGRRQRALDTLRACRRGPVELSGTNRSALDRLEQAIIDDDIFLDSPAAVEPRSLGAEAPRSPMPTATVAPVGIIDTTGAIAGVLERIDDGERVTWLVAPAGGGKSSAVRLITSELPPRGWHCFTTTCSPLASDPLAPLIDLDDQRRDRTGGAVAVRSAGEVAGERAAQLLTDVTTGGTRRILLVVDDVHHASAATHEWLSRLVDRVSEVEHDVSILLTARPGYHLGPITGSVVEMPPWDLAAVTSYLHSFVPPGIWASGAARWVDARSTGNPLLVRELTVDVLRRLPDEPTIVAFVPPEMASLVAHGSEFRFDSLPADLRDVLVIAAVLGDEFRVADLVALTVRTTSILATGHAHGLVEPIDTERFRFTHQRIRQAFLDLIDADELVELAHRVAVVIAKSPGSDHRLGDLAHFARTASSRHPDEAIEITLHQAQTAFDGLRMEEALNIARLGMHLVDDVEGRTVRWTRFAALAGCAAIDVGDDDAVHLLVESGTRAIELGEHDIVATVSSRLSSLTPTTGVGSPDEAAERLFDHAYEHVTDPAARAMVCLGGGFSATLRDDPDRARRLYFEAADMSARQGDLNIRAQVLSSAYTPLSQTDDVPHRREIAAELHRLAEELGRIDIEYSAHRFDLADAIHWGTSDPRGSMSEIERIAMILGQRSRNWSLFAFRATIALLDGDLEEAEFHAAGLLSDDVTASPQLSLSTYGAHLFAIRMLQGRIGELDTIASDLAREQPDLAIWRAVRVATAAEHDPTAARDAFDAVIGPDGHSLPESFTMLAGLYTMAYGTILLDDHPRMARMIEILTPYEDRWAWFNVGVVGPVDLILARLRGATGDRTGARACAARGLASARRVGAPRFSAEFAGSLTVGR